MGTRHGAPVHAAFGGVLVALVALVALAPDAVALDEVEAMLLRARSGEAPSERDRVLARELCAEWRDSEEVAARPGDQALGRALEAIALGRGLAGGELAAVARHHEDYVRARAEGPPTRTGALGALRKRAAELGGYLPVIGIAAAVLIAGVAWMLIARRRRAG